MSNCGTDLPIVTNKKDLENYHQSTLEIKRKNNAFDKSMKVYIDYSGGMFVPINECYDLIDEVITITNKRNTAFYNVGLGEPYQIEGNILESAHPKNPRKNSNYTDAESYLDAAVDSITTDYQSQSLFITDFELYRSGQFDPTPWATLSFENWLSKGHQIDVFAKEFTNSKNKSQYLYLIVFTPNHFPKETALIERLQTEGYTEKSDIEWFLFSDKIGDIEQNGSYDKTLIAPTQEYEYTKFAYYAFDLFDIQSTLEGKPLFKNISLKNKSQIYKNLKIDYELTDITKSFKNKEKGIEVNKDVFDISVDGNKELYKFEVKLSDKLQGLNVPKRLYRIDFYLTDADAAFDKDRMNNVLQWTDTNERTFTSLNKSLQEAVSRVKLKKKLLYTYYIELSI